MPFPCAHSALCRGRYTGTGRRCTRGEIRECGAVGAVWQIRERALYA